jgi:hypothetical protein
MTKIDNNEKYYSLPISCLNMHNLSIRVFIECPEAWVWQYIPGKRPLASRKMSHDFNLTYLVHFMCYLYLLTIQSALTTFLKPTVCAHKLNGCHWEIQFYLLSWKEPLLELGVIVEKGFQRDFGVSFFVSIRFSFCRSTNKVRSKRGGVLDLQTKRSPWQEDSREWGEGSVGGVMGKT